MNSILISYHIIKAQLSNIAANIKSLFKSKPKLETKPCYTSEVQIGNYYLLNLLKEIKIINFDTKDIKSFDDILKLFEEYPAVKSTFISTFIQNVILQMSEKYPDHLIYIEDFKPDKLVIKVHLIDAKIFKEIFVINEATHKETFENILNDSDFISAKIVKSTDNQGFSFIEQRYNDAIYYDKVVQLNTSFKSVIDIVHNSDNELTLYYLNETFTNKIVNELPNINNQIIDVLLSGKLINDYIVINKIL